MTQANGARLSGQPWHLLLVIERLLCTRLWRQAASKASEGYQSESLITPGRRALKEPSRPEQQKLGREEPATLWGS